MFLVGHHLFYLPQPNGAGLKSKTKMDIHTYNREAEDIDEIQQEDRQERMAKEKAKAGHLRYLRHQTTNAESTSPCIKSTSLEVEDGR